MKLPRFVTEYANHQRRCLDENIAMNPGIRRELKRRIDRAVTLCSRGGITINECMRIISLPETGEDMSEYME